MWAKDANILSKRLKEVKSNLEEIGIFYDIRHAGNFKKVTIERLEKIVAETVAAEKDECPKASRKEIRRASVERQERERKATMANCFRLVEEDDEFNPNPLPLLALLLPICRRKITKRLCKG